MEFLHIVEHRLAVTGEPVRDVLVDKASALQQVRKLLLDVELGLVSSVSYYRVPRRLWERHMSVPGRVVIAIP